MPISREVQFMCCLHLPSDWHLQSISVGRNEHIVGYGWQSTWTQMDPHWNSGAGPQKLGRSLRNHGVLRFGGWNKQQDHSHAVLVHTANPVAATKSNNTNKYNTAQALSSLMRSTPFVMHVGGHDFPPLIIWRFYVILD